MSKVANPTHVIVKSGISPVLAELANKDNEPSSKVIITFNINSP
jgi:hypothetical protein